jgi:hypothetical protein
MSKIRVLQEILWILRFSWFFMVLWNMKFEVMYGYVEDLRFCGECEAMRILLHNFSFYVNTFSMCIMIVGTLALI